MLDLRIRQSIGRDASQFIQQQILISLVAFTAKQLVPDQALYAGMLF